MNLIMTALLAELKLIFPGYILGLLEPATVGEVEIYISLCDGVWSQLVLHGELIHVVLPIDPAHPTLVPISSFELADPTSIERIIRHLLLNLESPDVPV